MDSDLEYSRLPRLHGRKSRWDQPQNFPAFSKPFERPPDNAAVQRSGADLLATAKLGHRPAVYTVKLIRTRAGPMLARLLAHDQKSRMAAIATYFVPYDTKYEMMRRSSELPKTRDGETTRV